MVDAVCHTFIASRRWLTSDRYWVRAESSVRGKPLVALYTSGTSMPHSIWGKRRVERYLVTVNSSCIME